MNWFSKKMVIQIIVILVIVAVVMRLAGVTHISDTFVGMMMGHCMGLIALKSWEKIKL
jgi:hypothetical protein